MLLKPDCIPCILQMSVSLLRQLQLSEDSVRGLYGRILEIPALQGRLWDLTSAEVIEQVMEQIVYAVEDPDPFRGERSRLNAAMMEHYPFLSRMVQNAPDPLHMACKLSIIGNAIDFMLPDSTKNVQKTVKERLEFSLSKDRYGVLVKQLQESKRLVYFGDNAGEIVFDKLLIETIKKRFQCEIVFVVRRVPTLNDATLEDTRFIGMDRIIPVTENGIDGPLPGTILKRCSRQVRKLVERADLIISKGGGNFDTLDEEKAALGKNIAFMLLSKCHPYHEHFGIERNRPILAHFFAEKHGNA
jgi:uncharacterized protein with ATP-grasp and redox domains